MFQYVPHVFDEDPHVALVKVHTVILSLSLSLWEACSGFHYLKLRCRLVSKCFRYCPWTVSSRVMKHMYEFNVAGFTLKIIARIRLQTRGDTSWSRSYPRRPISQQSSAIQFSMHCHSSLKTSGFPDSSRSCECSRLLQFDIFCSVSVVPWYFVYLWAMRPSLQQLQTLWSSCSCKRTYHLQQSSKIHGGAWRSSIIIEYQLARLVKDLFVRRHCSYSRNMRYFTGKMLMQRTGCSQMLVHVRSKIAHLKSSQVLFLGDSHQMCIALTWSDLAVWKLRKLRRLRRLFIWVCLKIVYPYTQWLMIIIPTKWL